MADPISAGVETAGTAAGEGAAQAMGGLSRLLFSGAPHPEDVGKGLLPEILSGLAGKGVALKDVVMGTLGVAGSPAAGLGRATQEAIKDYAPWADSVALPGGVGGVAPFLRSAAGDPLPSTLPMPLSEIAGLAAAALTPGGRRSAPKFRLAGEMVDGRRIRGTASNTASIGAELGRNYEVQKGVREVPLKAFQDSGKPAFYSVAEKADTEALAAAIKASGEIEPLIVVIDDSGKGPWILEGGHRYDALRLLGAKSFPALVVRDLNP